MKGSYFIAPPLHVCASMGDIEGGFLNGKKTKNKKERQCHRMFKFINLLFCSFLFKNVLIPFFDQKTNFIFCLNNILKPNSKFQTVREWFRHKNVERIKILLKLKPFKIFFFLFPFYIRQKQNTTFCYF